MAAPSAPSVRVNGWYRCNPSTLYPGDDFAPPRDPDYYLETTAPTTTTHGGKSAKAPHGDSTWSGSRSRPPTVTLDDRRKDSAPFLAQSLAFSRRQSAWGPSAATDEATTVRHQRHHHRKAPTDEDDGARYPDDGRPHYECAHIRVPMCYDGVCDSSRSIDVFVKRVVARARPAHGGPRKALWVLQGGPGASSMAMEDLLATMHAELDGEVAVYTMDHRGTGRSHRLACEAAAARSPGSPGGTQTTLEETPSCIQDVLFQIDNQTAAFSVTSAALDLKTIIEHVLPEDEVYVYGLSYGTYLVERLVHVAPSNVKGFIVDGIVSEAGATEIERSTYSNWDRDVGVVAERFFGYCAKDPFCRSKFAGVADLPAFVRDLYHRLDAAAEHYGTNPCADVLRVAGRRPSYVLRTAFGEFLMSAQWRVTIPAVIYRAARCAPADVAALQRFVDSISGTEDPTPDLEDLMFTSEMLYFLIVFSEMWEYPSPDVAAMVGFYEHALAASDNYYTLPYYCLFTGSREPGCQALKHLPRAPRPMMYERDQYWNVTARLPPNTSALLLSGGLDVQTRWMYGDLEFAQLEGDRLLVEFDYAGHCTTFTTPTRSGGATCGVQVLASFVRAGGDVWAVDTTCVGDVYGLEFGGTSPFLAQGLFGTLDLYD